MLKEPQDICCRRASRLSALSRREDFVSSLRCVGERHISVGHSHNLPAWTRPDVWVLLELSGLAQLKLRFAYTPTDLRAPRGFRGLFLATREAHSPSGALLNKLRTSCFNCRRVREGEAIRLYVNSG